MKSSQVSYSNTVMIVIKKTKKSYLRDLHDVLIV